RSSPVASAARETRAGPGRRSRRGDAAQHARAARTGRGRQVAGLSEDGEKAEEGERQGLLCLAVEEQPLERHEGPGGHAGGELLDEPRVAGAAAGQHQLVVGPRVDPALDRARDGLYRQGRRRRDRVVVRATAALHLVDQPRGVVRTYVLAPCSLAWSSCE